MTITIAGIDFDYQDYDERSDVLFLHVGRPNEPPAKAFETPEGHTVEYDEHGAVVGLELMGAFDGPSRAEASCSVATGSGRSQRASGGHRGVAPLATLPS